MKSTPKLIAFAAIATARNPQPAARRWFTISAEADSHTILIHQQIGKDWWSDDGLASGEFAQELGRIPKGRKITVRINSPGGSVHDGLAIYNLLKERRADVTVKVDGVAASIASVIACAGSTVIMPRNALFMIHNPWSRITGDEHAMRKAADMLAVHGDSIAIVYQERTGKPKDEILTAMDAETWMTGETAKAWGFASDITEEDAAQNIAPEIFSAAPEAVRVAAQSASRTRPDNGKTEPIMNRQQIIALLKKHGITVDDNATDAQLQALLDTTLARASAAAAGPASNQTPTPAPAPAPAPAAATTPTPAASPAPADNLVSLQAEVAAMRRERDTERRTRIERDVDACISENRIPANQRASWLTRAIADESVINDLRSMPVRFPGADPVNSVRVTSEDPNVIMTHLAGIRSRVSESDRFNPASARERGLAFASELNRHRARLADVFAANTIPTELKRQLILQDVMTAFAFPLLPLRAFATVFGGVTLQGTNKVNVPFIDLDSVASTDWNAANGYVPGDTTSDFREINVNKRKYKGIQFTSDELARQPYLLVADHMRQKVDKLAYDVVMDVLSVVTNANYGAAGFVGASAGFDSNDVVDLRGVCNTAKWPEMGRSLILNSEYDTALFKDSAIKSSEAFGGSEAIREGRIPKIAGFDYYMSIAIPANAEQLVGMAVFKSAILFANAPITPTPDVLQNLSRYEAIVDPITGATMEFRQWGSADYDRSTQVVECNYGYSKGNGSALKRLTIA